MCRAASNPHHLGPRSGVGARGSGRAGRYSKVPRSRARRTPASTGLDGWPWFETRWSEPGHATPYPRAAVGRRISRRWALNSRFCRAMKMSRLINTSGSPTSARSLPLAAAASPLLRPSAVSPPLRRLTRFRSTGAFFFFLFFFLSFFPSPFFPPFLVFSFVFETLSSFPLGKVQRDEIEGNNALDRGVFRRHVTLYIGIPPRG